jgi:hypothetical protein
MRKFLKTILLLLFILSIIGVAVIIIVPVLGKDIPQLEDVVKLIRDELPEKFKLTDIFNKEYDLLAGVLPEKFVADYADHIKAAMILFTAVLAVEIVFFILFALTHRGAKRKSRIRNLDNNIFEEAANVEGQEIRPEGVGEIGDLENPSTVPLNANPHTGESANPTTIDSIPGLGDLPIEQYDGGQHQSYLRSSSIFEVRETETREYEVRSMNKTRALKVFSTQREAADYSIRLETVLKKRYPNYDPHRGKSSRH